MAKARAQRYDKLQGPGNAEHHADAAAVEVPAGAVARVLEGHLGGKEAQELGAVGGFKRIGRQAEFGGVEINGKDEAAAAGVSAVGAFRVLVEIIFGQPVGGGNLGNGVHAVLDIGPEPARVLRFGEKAAYAYDGYG